MTALQQALSWPIVTPAQTITEPLGDAALGWREQRDVIDAAIAHHPRTLQVAVGPSEVGTPCQRKLAYRLAQTPEVPRQPGWLPTIGTATHTWLTESFLAANLASRDRGEPERWVVDQAITVTTPAGRVISGHFDLYDLATGELTDWKIVGKTTLTSARRHGPKLGYRAQLGIYAAGVRNLGLPVHRARIAYLPRNAGLHETQPLDVPMAEIDELAAWALDRYDRVYASVESLGRAMPALLPVADDHCTYCPWFDPGVTDAAIACGGHDALKVRQDPLLDLIS